MGFSLVTSHVFCSWSESKSFSSPLGSDQFHIAVFWYYALLLMGDNFSGYVWTAESQPHGKSGLHRFPSLLPRRDLITF